MRVECPQCHQIYNIPDERLPIGKKIVFPCPACKSSIKLDLRNSSSAESEEQAPKEDLQGDDLKKEVIASLSDLPPMPQVVMKAHQVMSDPGSSFKDLGAVIETDQAIAARVLKLANSAYYGLRGMVSSVHQASVVLGYEALGELITVVGASGLLDNILEGYRLESGFMWQHSLAVAFGAKMIAKIKIPRLENNAFSAGLLHDSGKLVLDKYVLAREERFEKIMADEKTTFFIAENEILGFNHGDIACEMCIKWGIPEEQATAIRYHHNPSMAQGNQLAYILHLADIISMKGGIGSGFDSMLYEAEDGAMDFIGLDTKDMESIMNEVVEYVDKIAEEMQR